ncbi:MAG: histidine phosphatase family protein [Solirubrobacteraceae bacterium]
MTLVRHAETEWSLAKRHTGRSDIPLSEHGRDAARALSERLRERRFALVLASPLLRARETCELSGLGARAQVRDDLMEWDYGEYEGLTTPEIRVRRPGWVLWRDGCPGGERAEQVGARADRVITELRASDGEVAVFSHGHMLRVIGARWIGLEPSVGRRLGLFTGAICLLGSEHGTPILTRWNATDL